MLKIYNTLGRTKQAFVPLRPGEVRMYVCGMTVYDYCHLGHARMLVVFDMVRRWLRASGYRVTYVRNITDIDDKIIRRAQENGEPIGGADRALHPRHGRGRRGARRREARPRAARHRSTCRRWSDMIGALEATGSLPTRPATATSTTRSARFPGYGKLSGKSLDELRAGERVEVDAVEAGSARLRAVEALQARRAELAFAVGRGPARLAHRVLGDERQAARRALRHPRRRPGPAVPAPRERDRAVRGRQRRASS